MLCELTTLYKKDLDAEKASEKIEKILEKHGAKITSKENQGIKRLAYRILGEEYATYYYYELELDDDKHNEIASKISQELNITDEVLRYLLVRVTR